jgi:uncharacterized membrane protein YphA (DoxX/SURF4 family)
MSADPRCELNVRFSLLKFILAAALAGGFLLSVKLWLSSRHYPLSPVADWLPAVPSPLDWVWFCTLLGLLGLIAGLPRARGPLFAFVALAGLLSLWDQTRWQPWFYQYLFMLGALAFCGSGRESSALNACRLIVASMYVWSGLQKFNLGFVSEVYPWLIEPFCRWLEQLSAWLADGGNPPAWLTELERLIRHRQAGWGPPVIEAAIGAGLLVPFTRKPAVVLAVLMHALIMLSIGPLGHDWNTVVWPWNAAMVLFVIILFWGTRDVPLSAVIVPRRVYHGLVLVLFGLMPALSFYNCWDAYLSACLYSGNTVQADLEVSAAVCEQLPPEVQKHAYRTGLDTYAVSVFRWAIGELNVPPYPAPRVYRSIARHFCKDALDAADVVLTIHPPDHWWGGTQREPIVYDAADLCPEKGLQRPEPER